MAGVICTETPPGKVAGFATAAAPAGWLPCNGQAVSRTTYSALFAAIGIAHGQGDGSTTFNVPDYRGYFLRGVDGGTGRDPDTGSRSAMNTGGNAGDAVGSVQGHQILSHTHTSPHASVGSGNDASLSGFGTNATTPDFVIGATGGNETRPLNAYVTYCIKF